MTLDQLKYFAAAATYQHVGRAANASNISSSVISAAISSLEEELDCELFKRQGRNISITTDGERLHKRIQTLLGEVSDLKSFVKNKPQTLTGKYRLAASHFLSSSHLVHAWSQLAETNPQLYGDIYSMNTAHAIAELLAGRIDLSLCFSPLRHPDIVERVVHRGDMVLVVRKKHPILKESPHQQIEFLAETPAIIHKSSQLADTCETHPVFASMGFEPKINLSFDSDHTAIQRVATSNAWSFLPDVVVKEYSHLIQPILPKFTLRKAPYHISALIHRQRENDLALQKLSQFLVFKN